MLNDAFLSIVQQKGMTDNLLVRARRPGDIEKVFGRRTKVSRITDADYLFRATITREDVKRAMENEVNRISYSNFKNSVEDKELHDAYMSVWTTMSKLQNPAPYSGWRVKRGLSGLGGGSFFFKDDPFKPSDDAPAKLSRKQRRKLKKATEENAKLPDSLLDGSLDDHIPFSGLTGSSIFKDEVADFVTKYKPSKEK
jgi:hypothetical protein